MKVLIIEDEKSVVDSLTLAFKKENYEVVSALDGEKGKEIFNKEKPDIVILDLMLPGIKGEELCRFIKEKSNTPIIVVSAKDSEIDKVLALELGADDYLVKPFSIRELLVRMKKRLEHAKKEIFSTARNVYQVGPFFLDEEKHEFKVENKPVELTPKEFSIMKMLLSQPKRVWTRNELTNQIWGYDYVSLKSIDVYIKKLREKLGKYGNLIKAIRGVGYKLEV